MLTLVILQSCTEMVMPTDGNNKESIFPPSKWDYNERAQFCKSIFGVEPRPNWVTTEFGGYVSGSLQPGSK